MKKKNIIIVVIVVVVLVGAIAVLAILNAPKGEIESGTLTVVSGGETIGTFSMEELQDMEYVEVEKEIVSSSYQNDEGTFRGVPLRSIISACDENILENATQVVIRSEDAYVTAYSAEDVAESDNIFLAYSKNGESLGNKENGGVGPFRIIVTEDEFGNRCAKYVCEIEVK